jgi:uncharacterized cupredoxin-like copper-binding protein
LTPHRARRRFGVASSDSRTCATKGDQLTLAARLAGMTLALAMIAGCGQAASSPSAATGGAESVTQSAPSVEIQLADFKILPAEASVPADFVLLVSNAGPTPHNLTIRDESGAVGHATAEIAEGDTASLGGRLAPGRYITFCSLPGHESLGMTALLIVGP